MVDISQLIRGVNNALNGCPPQNTPTSTASAATPANTETATPTEGEAPTQTPVATVTQTAPATATSTPIPTATPTLGDGLGTGNCAFGPTTSQLYASAYPVPLGLPLSGSVRITCGGLTGDDTASCTCALERIDPSTIPGIGKFCFSAGTDTCPAGSIACSGGSPLGVDAVADGNIGTCTSNSVCASACDTFCAARGSGRASSGCTGYCTAGSMQSCNRDVDCQPASGLCNGPDPVAARRERCQCQCVDATAGGAARAGELQCNMATALKVVDMMAACDAPATIDYGSACAALTTATASSIIHDTNFTTNTLPAAGPVQLDGEPLMCSAFDSGTLTGTEIRGVVTFLGSTITIGDIIAAVSVNCQ
jgi:hypothetical protein